MSQQQEHICKTCGNHFRGYYCNQCGEKVLLPQDRSFRKFLSNLMVAITLADNKFIRMLWLIVTKPGFLSREMAEGRRVKYLSPLSVFFVLNLFYFLIPTIQLFNASLKTQLNSFHGSISAVVVAAKKVELGIRDVNAFAMVYDQKTTTLAKMLVILYAVIASLPLNLIYRSKNRYFTDHVGLAVELVCFNLFINALLLTLIVNAFGLGPFLNEYRLAAILLTTNLYFLIRSGHFFYREKPVKLVLKSILMILVLKLSLELYRFILFYITIWVL